MNIKKWIAVCCIAAGVVFMAIPFYYHFSGKAETEKLMEEFEQNLKGPDKGYEEKEKETENMAKTEEPDSEREQTSGSEEETSILEENTAQVRNVIGMIEIADLGIRYPVVEGTAPADIAYAIGHMSDTAGIGESGNCVLAGHNGSRNGTFFNDLHKVQKGTIVQLTDWQGNTHSYEVMEFYITDPYDSKVTEQADTEILTLFTCAEKGTMRFICRCVPIMEGGVVSE